MPHCAVIWCNNQSKNVTKQNSGVSYHKFPHDPVIKDKWIFATGKYNWFPQKHDSICSIHFEAAEISTKGRRCLPSGAIPTLKLHPIMDGINSSRNTDDDIAPAKCRKITGEDSQAHVEQVTETSQGSPQVPPEDIYSPNMEDTPLRRKLKLSVIRAQETIRRQRLQVKRLRETNRRLLKKVAKMGNIIKYLREKSATTDEDITNVRQVANSKVEAQVRRRRGASVVRAKGRMC